MPVSGQRRYLTAFRATEIACKTICLLVAGAVTSPRRYGSIAQHRHGRHGELYPSDAESTLDARHHCLDRRALIEAFELSAVDVDQRHGLAARTAFELGRGASVRVDVMLHHAHAIFLKEATCALAVRAPTGREHRDRRRAHRRQQLARARFSSAGCTLGRRHRHNHRRNCRRRENRRIRRQIWLIFRRIRRSERDRCWLDFHGLCCARLGRSGRTLCDTLRLYDRRGAKRARGQEPAADRDHQSKKTNRRPAQASPSAAASVTQTQHALPSWPHRQAVLVATHGVIMPYVERPLKDCPSGPRRRRAGGTSFVHRRSRRHCKPDHYRGTRANCPDALRKQRAIRPCARR